MSCCIYPSSCHNPAWLDKPGLLSAPEMKKALDLLLGDLCTGREKPAVQRESREADSAPHF